MRNIAAVILGLAVALPVGAQAQVTVRFNVPLPPAPPLVFVQPEVQVVEDHDEEVFFHGGFYWVRRDGRWFRSHHPQAEFVYVEPHVIPAPLVGLEVGRYRRFHHGMSPAEREHFRREAFHREEIREHEYRRHHEAEFRERERHRAEERRRFEEERRAEHERHRAVEARHDREVHREELRHEPRHEEPRHEMQRHEPPRHEMQQHEPPRHEMQRHDPPPHREAQHVEQRPHVSPASSSGSTPPQRQSGGGHHDRH